MKFVSIGLHLRFLPLWGLTLLSFASCGAPEEPLAAGKSVLLITLDTTRADILSCLGGPEGLTPNLDALAAEGVLYTAARTVAPLTMPAHASIMTGLYPPRHGVRDNNVRRLPLAAETLAEMASANGYQTAAFVSSVAVDSAFGFGQGFTLYDEPSRQMNQWDGHEGARNGIQVIKRALRWLDEDLDPEQPFFSWVHIWDPHAPYAPIQPFLQKSGGDPYGAEVFAADFALGKLFDDLKVRGLWDDLCVIVVADHGEGRGDLGEPTHGTYLWDSTIRVPLIVRNPGGARVGMASSESVTVADVAPTALAAMGLRVPSGLDGLSLLDGEVDPERGVYFESYVGWTYYGWSPLIGWANSDGVLLQSSAPRFVPANVTDPADSRAAGRAIEDQDAAFVNAAQRSIARVLGAPRLRPDDESAEIGLLTSLQGLGYAATGVVGEDLPAPFSEEAMGRPCPMDRVEEHVATLRAMDLVGAGRTEEGLIALREVLALNPNNAKALGRAADMLSAEGRYGEARPLLERLLAVGPPSPGVHYQLGVIAFDEERLAIARDHWRAALMIDPGQIQSRESLAQWHELHGDEEEAQRLRAGGELR
ncbi:MAG: choline-sulfatase [Planctomycetota bacterium]